jgi:mutator protein MutT
MHEFARLESVGTKVAFLAGPTGEFGPQDSFATLARQPMPRIDVAIAIIARESRILVCQRRADDVFGGYWEFPGGKRETDETLEQCLARELSEELNIQARPIARLSSIEHDYPHGQIRLNPFICVHERGEIEHLQCQASRWIDPASLGDYQFPPANERLIEETIEFCARNDFPSLSHRG